MSLVPRENRFGFDIMLNDLFPSLMHAEKDFFSPRVDVNEHADHYEILADLPGIDKDDIHVSLVDGVLRLEASRKTENKEEKEGKVIRKERHVGSYMRSFHLGDDVKDTDIHANFENGVLRITAPKIQEREPSRKDIQIN